MGFGYQLVQSAHATVQFVMEFPEASKKWYTDSEYMAVLKVSCIGELLILMEAAEDLGVLYSAFHEPDLNGEVTAVAFEVCEGSRKLLSHLKLAGK